MRLIDVDALMVVLEKVPAVGFKNIDNQTYTLVLLAQVLNIIKQQPTIEERKTGKWEEIRVMPEAYDITGEKTWASVMRCNKCGFEAFAIEGHFAQYHFCPNCGADMRGAE